MGAPKLRQYASASCALGDLYTPSPIRVTRGAGPDAHAARSAAGTSRQRVRERRIGKAHGCAEEQEARDFSACGPGAGWDEMTIGMFSAVLAA